MAVKHPTSSVFVFRRFTDGWRTGLIRHPRLHKMMIPGGHVEPGESAAEAALREVAEETGLAVEVVRLGSVEFRAASLPAAPHGQVGLVYVCRILGGELRTSHESLELAWRDPADPAIEWHLDHGERTLRALAAIGV